MERAHFHHLYDLQIKNKNSMTIKNLEKYPRYIHTKFQAARSKDKKDMPRTCSKTHEGIGLSG